MKKRYDEYRDTNATWLGEIPATWEVSKLKWHLRRTEPRNPGGVQVLSLYRELGIVPKNSRDDNHNVTSEDTSNYKYVKSGDFVVNKMKAWQGSVAVSEYEGIVSPAYYVYHFIDDKFHRKYFHYLIRGCYKEEFMRLSGGIRIGQWDLSSDALNNVLVIIPKMSEQIRIAEYLDKKISEIDALIENAETSVEEYKKWKFSVIYEVITKGLNKEVSYKNSGVEWIGEIPETWDMVPLKRIYNYESGSAVRVGPFGSALSGTDIVEDGVWVYNQRTVLDRNFETNDTFVSEEKAIELQNFVVKEGDILITTRGSIGKIAIVPKEAPYGILHPCIIRFRTKKELVSDELLEIIFNESNFMDIQMRRMSNSTTIDVLYSYSLKELIIPIIPTEEQEEITEFLRKYCDDINSLIEKKQELINDLKAYKKSLIFEVVTGKRKVV